jgi:hypothetical protein
MGTNNLIGGAWLAAHHGLQFVHPLTVQSRIGGRRKTELVDGVALETFVEAMRPAASLRGHLIFHLGLRDPLWAAQSHRTRDQAINRPGLQRAAGRFECRRRQPVGSLGLSRDQDQGEIQFIHQIQREIHPIDLRKPLAG